jgi:DNA-binding MarR family transcriptional regulator
MSDIDPTQSGIPVPEDGIEPIPGPDVDPVEQLAHLVPALWRTIKRAAGSADRLPANESQVTILRMLMLHGDLTPARLAELLYVARPTVSNLLKDLVAAGLVERRAAEHDARSVVVSATEAGRGVLAEFRSDRVRVLREAIDVLPADRAKTLRDGIPSLRLLLRELEVIAAAEDESAETA